MASNGSRYRGLLGQSRFRALLASFLIDGAASWAAATVIAVLLYDRTGSTLWIAAAGAARWIPTLVLGPFGGVIADRYERTRVMAVSAGLTCVVVAVLAVVVATDGPLLVIVALLALQATAVIPYGPAVSAILPAVVPETDLAAANSLREVVANLNVIVGPAIGALVLALHSPAVAIALDSASYLVPVTVALRLGVRSRGEAGEGSPFAEALAGVKVLTAHRSALLLVLACGLDSAIVGMGMVLFVPISERIGTGSDGYGYLLIASSVGSVAAAGLASRLAAQTRLAAVIIGSLLVQSVPYTLIVFVHVPAVVLGLVLLSGAGMIVVDILAITALQRDMPGAFLGRVFAVLDTVVLAGVLLANVIGSAVQTAAGLTPALLVLGLGFPLVGLLLLPSLLQLDRRVAETAARIAPVVDLLGGLELFADAERTALEGLALSATPVHADAGTVLIREGDAADDLWILTSGTLAVTSSRARDIPAVEAPGYVGELGLLRHGVRTATVTTAGPCDLLRVDGPEFLAAVEGEAVGSPLSALSLQRLRRTAPRPDRAPARPRPRPSS